MNLEKFPEIGCNDKGVHLAFARHFARFTDLDLCPGCLASLARWLFSLKPHQYALLVPEDVRPWSQRVGFAVMVSRAEVASGFQPLQCHSVHAELFCHLTGADPLALWRRDHW